MDIAVIKNQVQYEVAVRSLETLMDIDPEPGTVEADRLELLGMLLEDYESKHVDIGLPDPVDAIKFRMEQQALKQRDLATYIGSVNRVSEVLARKRPLTLRMIRALNRGLGIPAEVLIQEAGAQIPDDMGIDWQKFPINEMVKRDWFVGFKGSLQDAKVHSEELMRGLLQNMNHQKAAFALYRQADHIRSNREMDRFALLAWQGYVLQQASQQRLKNKYEQGTVNKEFMQDLVKLSWQDNGPIVAKEYLNRHGIYLITEYHLKKTYLDGAAMCLANGSPVIALTLRHDRLDNFWFTLMHELAHVALHFNNDECIPYFDDLDDKSPKAKVEREADELAEEVLIPNKIWCTCDARTTHDQQDINHLAKSLNIHPAIIAGRIRYETGNYRLLSRLLGNNQVKRQFA